MTPVEPNAEFKLESIVPNKLAGDRLDRALAKIFTDYSRARMQMWLREGRVTVNGDVCTNIRAPMDGGEHILVRAVLQKDSSARAEDIDLNILYRDRHLLVLDKPAGLVVHPGAGNPDGTLVNALLHLDPTLSCLARAGIVHRLDKLTTGLMVVACTLAAQTQLTRMIAARDVDRQYQAIVHGLAPVNGSIDAPIGRHHAHRTRMAVRNDGRHARTEFQRLKLFEGHSHLHLKLHTGRTHQIRVHLSHLGFPIVGDRDYGGIRPAPARVGEAVARASLAFPRQALHACNLQFEHPIESKTVSVSSPLPADMAGLLAVLEEGQTKA